MSDRLSGSQVWKFPVEPKSGWTSMQVPRGAQWLAVAEQGREICAWAIIPSGTPLDWEKDYRCVEDRRLAFVATGEDIPKAAEGRRREYMTTLQINTRMGELVFHVFEER